LFIQTIESFEVPLLLGGRGLMKDYTTQVYFNTSRMPTDWGLSSTYSMVLLFLSLGLLYIYFQLVRHGERYQTITGKDYRPRRIDLGAWKYLTCALGLLLARFRPPSAETLATMSLINYRTLLTEGGYALKPLWNSTVLGVGTATVIMLLVAAISYFVHKTRLGGRKLLDFLAFAPIALPSVVLASAFLWLYLLVPLPVIGTLSIIGLAYLT